MSVLISSLMALTLFPIWSLSARTALTLSILCI
jgi:hypothetical protein